MHFTTVLSLFSIAAARAFATPVMDVEARTSENHVALTQRQTASGCNYLCVLSTILSLCICILSRPSQLTNPHLALLHAAVCRLSANALTVRDPIMGPETPCLIGLQATELTVIRGHLPRQPQTAATPPLPLPRSFIVGGNTQFPGYCCRTAEDQVLEGITGTEALEYLSPDRFDVEN